MNKILLSKIVAVFHILLIFIPFLLRIIFINQNKYDIYLLLFIFIIRFHWFFFKGECIISYLEKIIVLPNYKLGKDIFSSPSKEILGSNKIELKSDFLDAYSSFTDHFFTFFILFLNIKSKQFNLLLVIALVSTVLNIYSNIEISLYIKKRRRQLKKKLKKGIINKNQLFVSDLVIY